VGVTGEPHDELEIIFDVFRTHHVNLHID